MMNTVKNIYKNYNYSLDSAVILNKLENNQIEKQKDIGKSMTNKIY